MRRLLKWFLLATLALHVVGGAVLLFVHFNQEVMVYQAFPRLIATPEEWGHRYEDVRLTTPDGETLHGWYLPVENPRGTILYCHGNAGNISFRQKAARGLTQLGFDVFMFDYRGFGESTGSPDEEGTYRDVETAWRYLSEERRQAPSRIVVWGRSLGGAIAIFLASTVRPGALVIESTFTSLPELAVQLYPIPDATWVTVKYPSLERIHQIEVPLLHAHSPDDTLIEMNHGRRLFDAAVSPLKRFVKLSGGHGEGHLTQLRYTDAIRAFLREAIPDEGEPEFK